MDIRTLVDHIYQNSSLSEFTNIKFTENPHVNVIDDIEFDSENRTYSPKINYVSLDNYTVEATIDEKNLKAIEDKYKFTQHTTNKAFLDVLISQAYKTLDNILIKYIDNKSTVEYLPFNNIRIKDVKKYLDKNIKFSFFSKPKIDKYDFFYGVLRHMCKKNYDLISHNNYIIVSPDLANFISNSPSTYFISTRKNKLPYIHEFGKLQILKDGRNNYGIPGVPYFIKVYVNPNAIGKELYFFTFSPSKINRFNPKITTFYYLNDNCFQEFLDINYKRTYRLLMYNKIYDSNNLTFNKLIFE